MVIGGVGIVGEVVAWKEGYIRFTSVHKFIA